jgi:hypothetical protein
MRRNEFIILALGFVMMISCDRPGNDVVDTGALPLIFPDYTETVVPVNIAPLNFKVTGSVEKTEALISGADNRIRIRGKNKIIIPIRKWRKILAENSNGRLSITLFTRHDGEWKRHKPFSVDVMDEEVDPWIVYRLIAPGYETWSGIGIYQRNLETFEEQTIIDNRLLPNACMNCHSFRANDPDNMMFHLRGTIGATILVKDGIVSKLNTKNKETISNCVYPYWHPSDDYIAYSVNNIQQVFHSVKDKRIEVFDSRSDIVVYDIRNNKLITSKTISSDDSFETFPAFSPDGRDLVFCSAKKMVQPDNYNKIRYSLCRVDFDAASGTFGTRVDTLVSSFITGKSVSFPRISPDGKYLVFTLSDYGNFSIWHREADLFKLDLETGDIYPIDMVNSSEAESYHSWSSNSRWMIFSSRRTDGLYTRLFIAYINENGEFKKPFMLPQKDPEYYELGLRSFNVPEFITDKVVVDGRSMLKSIDSKAKDVNFEIKE